MMYTVEQRYNETQHFDSIEEVLEFVKYNLDDEVYDDMLDECYDNVTFGSMSYAPSIALFRLDEVAYRVGKDEYFDSLVWDDLKYDLDRADEGDTIDFYDFTIILGDEDEE